MRKRKKTPKMIRNQDEEEEENKNEEEVKFEENDYTYIISLLRSVMLKSYYYHYTP